MGGTGPYRPVAVGTTTADTRVGGSHTGSRPHGCDIARSLEADLRAGFLQLRLGLLLAHLLTQRRRCVFDNFLGFLKANTTETAETGGKNLANDPDRKFVTTPRGTTFDVPGDWPSRPANNNKGIVFQDPKATTENANSIRIMEPNKKNPDGYFKFYNEAGQPLDVNGKPGAPSATHIPENYRGEIKGWPTP